MGSWPSDAPGPARPALLCPGAQDCRAHAVPGCASPAPTAKEPPAGSSSPTQARTCPSKAGDSQATGAGQLHGREVSVMGLSAARAEPRGEAGSWGP